MDNVILKLEHDISTFISSDNKCTVHFEYSIGKNPDKFLTDHTVSAYTVNPNSAETFLLKSETADTKEHALKKLLDYVKAQKGLNSFTVRWTKSGEAKPVVSYFYCHDVLDVVEKFFHGKNSVDYIVYEIKLNPSA